MADLAVDPAALDEFFRRWEASGAAERANYPVFLNKLCDLLDVPRPDPAGPDDEKNAYVFERAVPFPNPDGTTTEKRFDLYKRDCLVLGANSEIVVYDVPGTLRNSCVWCPRYSCVWCPRNSCPQNPKAETTLAQDDELHMLSPEPRTTSCICCPQNPCPQNPSEPSGGGRSNANWLAKHGRLLMGGITRVRICGRVLTDDEMMVLYESDYAPSGSPVTEFLLNADSETTSVDTSALASDGAVVDGVWAVQV
jgi:hypothetical protein